MIFFISTPGGAILVVEIFYTLTTKMAPPGGEIYFLFHTSNAKFPSLSHAKEKFRISLIS